METEMVLYLLYNINTSVPTGAQVEDLTTEWT